MGNPVPVAAPLAGVRVVTTRGAAHEDRLRALLEMAGARVLAWPTSEYPPPRDPGPLEAALARLDRFDWVVFTSARAVAAVGEGPAARATGGSAPALRVAVVGPATARAATGAGWTVAVEGRGPGARGLAAQVAATFPVAGARVLFPAASGAAPTLEEEFTALGARVTRVEAYRTVVTPPPAERVRADLAAGVDAVTFASPSAVEAVDRALGGKVASATCEGATRVGAAGDEATRGRAAGDGVTGDRATGDGATGDGVTGDEAAGDAPKGDAPTADGTRGLARVLAGTAVVCIGPTTGAALKRLGISDVRVAATATLEAMIEAVVAALGGSRHAAAETAGRSDGATGPRGHPDGATGPRGRPDADLGCGSSGARIPIGLPGRRHADLGRAAGVGDRPPGSSRPHALSATTVIAGRQTGDRP